MYFFTSIRHNIHEEMVEFLRYDQECNICFCEKSGRDFYRLLPCKHHFCKECLAEHCSVHVKEGTVQHLLWVVKYMFYEIILPFFKVSIINILTILRLLEVNISTCLFARVAQWVRSLDLTAHTSLSLIRHGFAPSFVIYKKECTRPAVASDKVYQLLAQSRWFSLGTLASSTTKTGRHDIAEILLKVALKHQKSKKNICLYLWRLLFKPDNKPLNQTF